MHTVFIKNNQVWGFLCHLGEPSFYRTGSTVPVVWLVFSQYPPFPVLHNIWLFSVKGHMTGQWFVDPPAVPQLSSPRLLTHRNIAHTQLYIHMNTENITFFIQHILCRTAFRPVRTIEQGDIFSCWSRSNSIGIDNTVPVVGLLW